MRVYDINVVADLTRKDPTASNPEEPAVYDGTPEGSIYTPRIAMKETVNSIFDDVTNFITIYWTGWWPELHFVINHAISQAVTITLDLSIDVLGIIHLSSFDLKFMGLETKSESEISMLVAEIKSAFPSTTGSVTGSAADYFLAGAVIAWAAAEAIAQWAPPTMASEIAFWLAIGAFTALTISGLVLLAQDVANANTDPYLSALVFFGMALSLPGPKSSLNTDPTRASFLRC